MSDVDELVDRYISAWNETDTDRRAEVIREVWTEEGTYTDPLAQARGHAAIDGVISAVQAQFAGHRFKLLKTAESHHNLARFSWELVPASGGESIVIGTDVAVIADDGRFAGVGGFLDKVPAA